MRALLAMTFTLLIPQIALAADWRYCLAPSHSEHKTYVTPAFRTTMPMDEAETQFASSLHRSGLRYDDVQCPRSDDEPSIIIMQDHAITVNHELGNEIINLRWKPAS